MVGYRRPKHKRFGLLSFVFFSNLQIFKTYFFSLSNTTVRRKKYKKLSAVARKKQNKKKEKVLSFFGPTSHVQSFQIFNQRQVRLLSIFVGQSLYLFEVRHNPAKDFS